MSLFKIDNLITAFKALAVNIVAGLIFIIPMALIRWIGLSFPIVMAIIGIAIFVIYLFVWGWLADKFWSWD